MSTDELLDRLPKMIGNHLNESGRYIIKEEYDEIGYITLTSKYSIWQASYGMEPYLCINPSSDAPKDYAVAWGKTPNEALQGLYDWCVENGFIEK